MRGWLLLLLGVAFADAAEPLRLPEVLASAQGRYPPLLIALIEQDIASGRLRR